MDQWTCPLIIILAYSSISLRYLHEYARIIHIRPVNWSEFSSKELGRTFLSEILRHITVYI